MKCRPYATLLRPKFLIAALAWHVLAAFWLPLVAFAAGPHWITGPQDVGRTWHFKRTFSVDSAVQAAELKFAADFCTAAVVINGQQVLTVESYSPTQTLDVTNFLRQGKNEIEISSTPMEGPAAAALSIAIVDKDGKSTTIATDDTWQTAVSKGEVPPELWGLGRRAATISPFDNYEQWQQAKTASPERAPKFFVPPRFEITRVHKATADEGSWIALAFDREGRATISREDTGLLRMTLAPDGRSVTRVEPIKVDLPECRGLVYLDGQLYANANNAKKLVRLRIEEDGAAADVQTLREFPGGVGHGRNDLALGPDGWIYSIHGDSVAAPGKPILDRTSPLRESRRGTPRQEGYLVRADHEGKQWELFCTGLRNPYGIAVNPAGDLFTYDADNEYDMGTPWYRPTRIVQLDSGADYGYRTAQGQWPPEYPDRPDNGLPTIDVGRGSPTAVMFGTNLEYPAPYREALFVLDWAYGRVLAVHLAPRGAGYRASLELFMQGQPLNVTDLAAGPDGALWLITGGRKTQSALYRVAFTGKAETLAAPGRHELDAVEFAARQRAVRQKLESLHGRADEAGARLAFARLADPDPRVRHAARIVVEQLPVAKILARFGESRKKETGDESDSSITGRLEVLMAVTRTGDTAVVPKLIDELLQLPTARLNLSAQFTVAFLYRECLRIAPEAVAAVRDKIIRQLDAIWPDLAKEGRRVGPLGDSAELRRRLALLLADLGDPGIIERVASSLFSSAVQEDRLQGLLALRNVRRGWTPATRQAHFTTLRDASRFVGGEGLPTFLGRLKSDAVVTLSEDERAKLAELLTPLSAKDEPLPPERPKVKAWSLEDLPLLAGTDSPRGDAERGAKVFRDALCSRCHRAGLVGPAVGPDLTFAARRFSRRDLLESIVAPSRSVAENYRNLSVVTQEGKVYVGRLLNEGDFRAEKLRLSVDPIRPSQIVEIDKRDIAQERLHDTSPMPQGLLDTFSREEIADLLAFLEDGAPGLK